MIVVLREESFALETIVLSTNSSALRLEFLFTTKDLDFLIIIRRYCAVYWRYIRTL